MRLGAPLLVVPSDPDEWIAQLRSRGYTAAVFPADHIPDEATADAYARAAREADIAIAEVGAWSNPLSDDESERKAALEKCKSRLALADRVGALCCVNIAGSRGEKWDGPDPRNFTEETFEMIVETVREIIDDVKPVRTFYTLEPMPWMYPDSAESYLQLIRAIDRSQFAVHYDPVNMIASPRHYYRNAELTREFVEQLGPYIKGVHVKDIQLAQHLTVHLQECRPGLGEFDLATLLRCLWELDPDMCLIMEHLRTEEDYALADQHIRTVAREVGVEIR